MPSLTWQIPPLAQVALCFAVHLIVSSPPRVEDIRIDDIPHFITSINHCPLHPPKVQRQSPILCSLRTPLRTSHDPQLEIQVALKHPCPDSILYGALEGCRSSVQRL